MISLSLDPAFVACIQAKAAPAPPDRAALTLGGRVLALGNKPLSFRLNPGLRALTLSRD